MSEVFNTLSRTDVNSKSESKNGLKYLSWAWAWAEVKKAYPDANYIVHEYDGKPYLHDENLGYMVSTKVTINGETIPMHLPVMDGANKAQKSADYTYDTKFKKDILVKSATMFDINKAIMRCLVKNLAMFGLGLYIYAGEDLPEVDPNVLTEDDLNWIKLIKSGQQKLEDITDESRRNKLKSHL
jgi:hypothetical protein